MIIEAAILSPHRQTTKDVQLWSQVACFGLVWTGAFYQVWWRGGGWGWCGCKDLSAEWRQMQIEKMGYPQRFKVWFSKIWTRTCSSMWHKNHHFPLAASSRTAKGEKLGAQLRHSVGTNFSQSPCEEFWSWSKWSRPKNNFFLKHPFDMKIHINIYL